MTASMRSLSGLLAVLGLGDRKYREVADRAFRFLIEEHGFASPEFKTDVYGASLVYRGPTVAVDVAWDKQERLVEVYVIRLRDGEIPLLVEEPQDWIYLSALLAIRAPHLVPALTERIGRTLGNVERILTAAAESLREHGRDAMAGEPGVFAEVFARYPQLRRRREWYQRSS
jgi:hypothetical protein